MSDVTIRPMNRGDARAVTSWFNRLVGEQSGIVEDRPVSEGQNNRFFESQVAAMESHRLLCLLALVGGEVTAKVDVRPLQRPINQHVAEVSFGVLSRHRDAGVFLLDEAAQRARSMRLACLVYYVMAHNELFIEVFKAADFVECGRIPRFYRRGNVFRDRVILCRCLRDG